MNRIFIYGVGVWFVILLFAVLNGVLRDFVYAPWVGDSVANQISSVLLCLIILGISCVFVWVGRFEESPSVYIYLGLVWVILTVAFEFLFFHYVTNHSWEELLGKYNIFKGNLWLLVVVMTGLSPWIASRLVK